jgi:DNA gyrase subunit A
MVTNTGTIIRINLSHVGVYGRDTQGVRMINIDEGGSLSMAAVVESETPEGSE